MKEHINPRNYKFCPVCGSGLKKKFIVAEQTNRLACSACPFIFYINPTPAVAVIILQDQQVLLVQRKYDPHKSSWSLPAGFMEYSETTQETAIREVKEETNLNIKVKGLFDVFPGFDDPLIHVVLIVYWGEIVSGDLSPGDDAQDVKFFPLHSLPQNVAFSAHRKILERLVSGQW